MNSRRANKAKLKRKHASSSPRGAIRKLFGGRLFTVKLGKKDKAGTVLTFEQTGGCEYTITPADIKNKKVRRLLSISSLSCLTLFSSPPSRVSPSSPQSIDGALKLNMKWRSAAVKAALQVRAYPLFLLVCFTLAHLCPARLPVARQDLTFDCGRMGSFQVTSLTYHREDSDCEGSDGGYEFSGTTRHSPSPHPVSHSLLLPSLSFLTLFSSPLLIFRLPGAVGRRAARGHHGPEHWRSPVYVTAGSSPPPPSRFYILHALTHSFAR